MEKCENISDILFGTGSNTGVVMTEWETNRKPALRAQCFLILQSSHAQVKGFLKKNNMANNIHFSF